MSAEESFNNNVRDRQGRRSSDRRRGQSASRVRFVPHAELIVGAQRRGLRSHSTNDRPPTLDRTGNSTNVRDATPVNNVRRASESNLSDQSINDNNANLDILYLLRTGQARVSNTDTSSTARTK